MVWLGPRFLSYPDWIWGRREISPKKKHPTGRQGYLRGAALRWADIAVRLVGMMENFAAVAKPSRCSRSYLICPSLDVALHITPVGKSTDDRGWGLI